MNLLPLCLVYTQDSGLRLKISGFLKFICTIRDVESPPELESLVRQLSPTMLVVDLTAKESRNVLPRILRTQPETVVIVLAPLSSEPALEAESMGVYAVEERDIDRHRFQSLVKRAIAHFRDSPAVAGYLDNLKNIFRQARVPANGSSAAPGGPASGRGDRRTRRATARPGWPR